MKKAIGFLTVSFLMLGAEAIAQEWTAEQLEVWRNVQTYSDLAAKGDVEGFVQYFHPEFSGWPVGSPVPQTQEERIDAVRHFMPQGRSLWTQLKPLAIKVHGDFAFVHYYYYSQLQQGDDEPQMEMGRWTDILMKQGNRWVMIGDHGGPQTDDD